MVNYLAVLVAAIAAYVVGFLWYGPVFGKKWMALMGLSEKDKEKAKQKGMAKAYVATFVSMLVMAYVLGSLMGPVLTLFAAYTGLGALTGAVGGAFVWLGFFATTMLGKVFWEGKSWTLYVLDAGHYLVTLVVMGAILGAWR